MLNSFSVRVFLVWKLKSPTFYLIGEAIYDPKISRRMMVGIIENGPLKNIVSRTAAQAPTLAPAPAPALVTGNDRLANRTSIV